MSELPLLESLPDFLLNAPLYKEYMWKFGGGVLLSVFGEMGHSPFDGYCLACGKETTYRVSGAGARSQRVHLHSDEIEDYIGDGCVEIKCSRNGEHKLIFSFYKSKNSIQKIGQFPSLADIANDEIKLYRSYMTPVDAAELHRAIGLAAHGVGVGAFVYLRRVFQRLILTKFQEVKEADWNEAMFKRMCMDEQIRHLKAYLPGFVVNNSKIYAILSKGIHELGEKECLENFSVLKDSLILVLKKDKEKKEEQAMEEELSKQIAGLSQAYSETS